MAIFSCIAAFQTNLILVLAFISSYFEPVTAFLDVIAPRNRHSMYLSRAHRVMNGSFSTKLRSSPHVDDVLPIEREFSKGKVRLSLYYRVHNPENMRRKGSDRQYKRPLVILHGGPSLPSQYLYSIVDNIPLDRSIVFYDQIGCGRSSEPKNLEFYSIEKSVDDLECLLKKLDIEEFHLLGHSYGGVLAYEYASRIAMRRNDETMSGNIPPKCLSITLANTSTNIEMGHKEWSRLENECAKDDSLPGKTTDEKFFQRNLCRLDKIPPELSSAFQHVGKVWFGTDVVSHWSATPLVSHYRKYLPPFMLIIGEYDFVTEICTSPWKNILGEALVKEEKMNDCSHYVHLEKPVLFGSMVDEFCCSNE